MLIAGFLQINFQIVSAAPYDALCTGFSVAGSTVVFAVVSTVVSTVVSAVVFAVVSAVVFAGVVEASSNAPAPFVCRQNTTLKKPASSVTVGGGSPDAAHAVK